MRTLPFLLARVAASAALFPVIAMAGEVPQPAGSSATYAELSLEQLMEIRIERVFGASKYEQKVTRAPAAVTIVSADEIAKYGHRTLADVLRSVRGLYVTSDRNYANFGIRGFARPGDFNTRVLLLVDGHRMNDNLYNSALIGAEGMLDTELVERVEVVRGPSSSIYGNSAFFGVINVVTRRAAEIDGLETSAEIGSFRSGRVRFAYGKVLKHELELVLSGSWSDSAGQPRLYYPEFDTPRNNLGVAEHADGERTRKLYGSLGWRNFTLSAGYSQREKDVPTASFGTAFNAGERTMDESLFADLKFERTLGENFHLTSRAFYDRYEYRATYPYDYAMPPAPKYLVLSHDENRGEGIGAEVQLDAALFDRHRLVFGAEWREDLHLLQSNFSDDPKTYNSYTDQQGRSRGIFAQGEFALGRDLIASAGLRYDYFAKFGGTLNPRFGLIYTPAPHTIYKALFGTAFRAPNAYESYLESPGFMKGNPALRPETIRTAELVYERYFVRNLRGSLSAYQYNARSLLTQSYDAADGLLAFRNANNIAARGVEVELEGRYARDLRVRASYAWQKTVDEMSRAELNNSPRNMAKFNASVPVLAKHTFASLELQYLSSLKTIAGTRAPGFLLTNLTLLARPFGSSGEISISAYNLFDQHYAYPGSTGHVQNVIPQDGRTWRVKLGYRF